MLLINHWQCTITTNNHRSKTPNYPFLPASYRVWQARLDSFLLVLFVCRSFVLATFISRLLAWRQSHSTVICLKQASSCVALSFRREPYHRRIWTAWHYCCEQSFYLSKWKTAVKTAPSLVVPKYLKQAWWNRLHSLKLPADSQLENPVNDATIHIGLKVDQFAWLHKSRT